MIEVDGEALRHRRRALKLALREVGAGCGLPWQRVSRLEDGDNSASLTLENVGRLAATLGLDARHLLKEDQVHLSPTSADTRVGAVVGWILAGTARRVPVWLISQHLGTSPAKLRSEIDAVNGSLAAIGLKLTERVEGLSLEPVGRVGAAPLTRRDIDRVEEANYAMTDTEAAVMWRVMRGQVRCISELKGADRIALDHLTALGIVREPSDLGRPYTLSAEARSGLLLEPEPHAN